MRILIVDDHADSRELVVEWMQMHGHEAVAAGSVAEALAATARETFDVIVTDLRLPDGSGSEIVARVRAAGQSPQAIAVTGAALDDDHPFDAVLQKPVDLARLTAALG